MITYRSRGLQTLHCCLQILLSWTLFWILVLTIFRGTNFAIDSYVSYALCIAIGLVIDSLRSNIRELNLLDLDNFGRARLALRQTMTVLVTLMFVLIALKDRTISRAFLSIFVPSLYVTLAAINLFLPNVLARKVFSGRHERRT